MSTTHEATSDESVIADEPYHFTPKLSANWALNLEQVAAVAIFGALYVVLNFIPLRATDIWGHVMYGHWILQHGGFPGSDPWMPLAAGMEVIDTAWLSQVIFAWVEGMFGPEALSHLFAAVNLLAYLVWARLFYLQTGRVWLSVVCVALLILVGWSRFSTVRPENFAVLCFAVVFLLAARVQWPSGDRSSGEAQDGRFDIWTWIGVPIVFALWANLHGSFIVGLAVLGCLFAGRVIEVAWETRDIGAVFRDRTVRRWLYLCELAAAATLLNPYGLDLWIHTIQFSSNPNLNSILEWQPLVIFGTGGRPFAISIVLLLVVWRQSRRPIRPAEVLLLLVFGFAAINGIRMLGWYAPVFVAVVAPHIADIVGRWLPSRVTASHQLDASETASEPIEPDAEGEYELPPGQSFRYSLVALLLIWIAFALSPSSQIIFNKTRRPEQLYSSDTPLQLTAYLNDAYSADPAADAALPGGQTFHPQWWGDWLKRAGPPELEAFATSNIHLVPPQVWRDYQRVMGMQTGWESALNRYNVTTMIVDREQQPSMYRTLNRSENWSRRYEDDQSAVFVREDPTPTEPRTTKPPEAVTETEAA